MAKDNFDELFIDFKRAVDGVPVVIEKILYKYANKIMAEAILGTTSGTGDLKGKWEIGKITRTSDTYKIEIINTSDYASYVEKGHYQEPGRFIPGEWNNDNQFIYIKGHDEGMVLVKSWVNGKFMITVPLKRAQLELNREIDNEIDKLFK